jgi:hypothetical protein
MPEAITNHKGEPYVARAVLQVFDTSNKQIKDIRVYLTSRDMESLAAWWDGVQYRQTEEDSHE